ncbi:hypothetical protein [Brevundimonas sp.]|uniref:hypothetical protein n=1 Tax=Brevundimonas sp. TaxID=1871086 RepID=UPI003BA8DFD8
MARLTIPDEPTFRQFTVVGSTSAFPISFSIFAKADLTVLVNGVALLQSGFTFSGTILDGGGYDGGTVTLNTAVSNTKVRIERNIKRARTSNFAPSASTPVSSVDQALNRLTAVDQDLARYVDDRADDLQEQLDDAVAEATGELAMYGKMDKAANLSDVADPDAARHNIEAPDLTDPRFVDNRGMAGTGVIGRFEAGCVMIIGDSITRGSGTNPKLGLGLLTTRSVMNFTDNGPGRDRGQMHGVVLNMATSLDQYGVSSDGTLTAGGLAEYRLLLTAGQSITITGRAYQRIDAFYDADGSPGSVEVVVNGVVVSTIATAGGTGVKRLGLTYPIASTVSVDPLDTVQLRATGGNVLLQGVVTIGDSRRPLCYMAADSGTGYQHWNSATQLDRIAAIMNAYYSDQSKVVQLQLGTNNIYSGSHLTPAAMITEIETFIIGLNSRVTGVRYNIAVPPISPPSNGGPGGGAVVQEPGYTYDDYRKAIMAFAAANYYGLVRFDQCEPSRNPANLVDTVHPGAAGHAAFAVEACRALGIPLNGNDPYSQQVRSGNVDVSGFLSVGASIVDTIASGLLKPRATFCRVATEGGAGSDDLTNLPTDRRIGTILILRQATSAQNVVVKDGTTSGGNIYLSGSDFTLTNIRDKLMLICEGSYWSEISRSNNG